MLATGPAHAVTTVRVLALSDREWRVSDMGPDSCMLFVGTVLSVGSRTHSKSSWEMMGQRHERKFRDYF
jgi:hypothetical protein